MYGIFAWKITYCHAIIICGANSFSVSQIMD